MTTSRLYKAQVAGVAMSFAAGLIATTGAANATNFDISNVGFIGDSTNLSGMINGNPFGESANTGLITLTTTTGSILPVFCIDLFHDINAGSQSPPLPYTTGTIVADSSSNPAGTGGNPLNPPVPGQIQTLANLGYWDYVHGAGNADIYAGLQGAIWDIEYNTNGNSLTVTGSPAVNALIASDIAYAVAHPAAYSVSLFPGADGQAFGSGQGFSPGVPEPSTWAMMLLGLAGLGFAGYRNVKAKALFSEA
jgi:PEP-CTERM motif